MEINNTKKLFHTVELVMFEDDANGEWGLAHKETYGESNESAFNAFWGSMGIFHDVFEHWHEFKDPHFRGDYAMNVGGEMAAMGAMWYYFDTMGFYTRMANNRSVYSNSDQMRLTTESEINEAIHSGWCNYGYTLESNVPKQERTENEELEYQIKLLYKNSKSYEFDNSYCGEHYDYQDEKEFSKRYKKSVTKRKVKDLHRYGYYLAEKLIPDNNHNLSMLQEFWDYWNQFCTQWKAEELRNMGINGITFELYKDSNDCVTWKAILNNDLGYISEPYIIDPCESSHVPNYEEILGEYDNELYY